MKRILVALTLFSGLAAAQVQAPPPGSERPQVQAEQTAAASNSADRSSVDRSLAPSYSDVYCAGFITKEKLPSGNPVLAELNPDISRMVERGTIFVSAAGLNVGSRYSVVRLVHDPNHQELFPGQNSKLNKVGNLYSDVGRVLITRIDGDAAAAAVEFTCDPIVIGDTLIPFIERPRPAFRTGKRNFERFATSEKATSGRVIMGKDFDEFVGLHSKVYLDIGSTQGLKPGDYLRISRSLKAKDMPPVERLSLNAPFTEDTQKKPYPQKKSTGNRLPLKGVGELMVLNTTPDSATAVITLSVEDIHVGDVVEMEPQ